MAYYSGSDCTPAIFHWFNEYCSTSACGRGNFLSRPINPILLRLVPLSHPNRHASTCETSPDCSKTVALKLHKSKTPVFISLTIYLSDPVQHYSGTFYLEAPRLYCNLGLVCKVKTRFLWFIWVPCYDGVWEENSIVLRSFNLSTRWKWVIIFPFRPL